jgi:hypothetical protein
MNVDRRDYDHAETPRSIIQTSLVCSVCGERSTFDGLGAEWCSQCKSAEYLETHENLYRLVEIKLN